jgi:hypothetical protein
MNEDSLLFYDNKSNEAIHGSFKYFAEQPADIHIMIKEQTNFL